MKLNPVPICYIDISQHARFCLQSVRPSTHFLDSFNMSDKIRIMVVDDDEDVLMLLQTFLEPKYDLHLFTDSVDAYDNIEDVRPELFLLDVMMKGMDGYELLSKIRAKPGYLKTPVLMLSGAVSAENIRKGYSSGATIYLCKPFVPENILHFIERQVDNLSTRKENSDFIKKSILNSCE